MQAYGQPDGIAPQPSSPRFSKLAQLWTLSYRPMFNAVPWTHPSSPYSKPQEMPLTPTFPCFLQIFHSSLSVEIDSHCYSNLLDSSNNRNRARLHSLVLPHAGDWVDVVPSPSLGLNLNSRLFGAAMGYRLGLTLMQEKDCDSSSCHQSQDKYGDHAISTIDRIAGA